MCVCVCAQHNSFSVYKSETFCNILMILGRIIENGKAECHVQELKHSSFLFSSYSPFFDFF